MTLKTKEDMFEKITFSFSSILTWLFLGFIMGRAVQVPPQAHENIIFAVAIAVTTVAMLGIYSLRIKSLERHEQIAKHIKELHLSRLKELDDGK